LPSTESLKYNISNKSLLLKHTRCRAAYYCWFPNKTFYTARYSFWCCQGSRRVPCSASAMPKPHPRVVHSSCTWEP